MPIKHSADIPVQVVKAGDLTTIQVLLQGPNFAMRRFVMEPGGGMPRHTNTVEHEQFILCGRARIAIGDEDYVVQAGDVVFIPEGVAHSYQNLGEENFEFLCMIPNKEDVVTILGQEC